MQLPEACLFDLDGVLLDTEDLHSQAWSKAAEVCGAKLNEEQLILLKGRRRIECAELILKWVPKALRVDEFLEIHHPISRSMMNNVQSMPGAERLIKWCFEKQLPMALVTSSSSGSVALKSANHPWLKSINTRVYGDDSSLRHGKPFPDPFLLAANKLKANPQYCWAIEDSLSGTKAALSAKCIVWLLTKSINPYENNDELGSSLKINYINHLDEILDKLKQANI